MCDLEDYLVRRGIGDDEMGVAREATREYVEAYEFACGVTVAAGGDARDEVGGAARETKRDWERIA